MARYLQRVKEAILYLLLEKEGGDLVVPVNGLFTYVRPENSVRRFLRRQRRGGAFGLGRGSYPGEVIGERSASFSGGGEVCLYALKSRQGQVGGKGSTCFGGRQRPVWKNKKVWGGRPA